MTCLRTMICGLTLLLVGASGLGGCARKPTEEECTKAVENIRHLTGQSRSEGGINPKAAVRSCRSRSTLATVNCQSKAQTIEALAACEGEEGKRYLEEQEKHDAEMAAKQAAEAPAGETHPAPAAGKPTDPTQGATPPTQGATPPTQGATPPTQGATPTTQGATPTTDPAAAGATAPAGATPPAAPPAATPR
jgi:hypothetical protein